MSYGEIKATSEVVLRLGPKWLFSSETSKSIDMKYVQRLFLCEEVKPQANGGRKIWLLKRMYI